MNVRNSICNSLHPNQSNIFHKVLFSRAYSSVGYQTKRFRTYSSINADVLKFGQPLHETHPHLLRPKEITPGITAQEYSDRRSRLSSLLPEKSIAILVSSSTKYRSGAVFYEYHQDSNFFYLTGFKEPEAVAVIQKDKSSTDYIFYLFVRPKDSFAEQWNGARSGQQAALDVFNADETGDIKDIQKLLPPLISQASHVFTNLPDVSTTRQFFERRNEPHCEFRKMLQKTNFRSLLPLMNDLRIFKSKSEIENMLIAGQSSGLAFTNAMRNKWTEEKNLRGFLEYEFKLNGCDTTAYVPVVAGGKNALCIHYVQNDDLLLDGQMVLTDAGGEYGGYIADITRSWPINGKFTDAQKDLYEAILQVQRKCISFCREDANLSLNGIHAIAENGLKENLRQIGFEMSGNAISTLFPHHIGHYIGLDVHDCAGYSRSMQLKSGYCVTVEPGVYVPNDMRWPKHFRGMGIRIEDSICVQDDSPKNLTTKAVKEVVDIESLRV